MDKFTPGPWRVIDREVMPDKSVYPTHVVGGGHEFEICLLETMGLAEIFAADSEAHKSANKFIKANAKLIAAAPDLLEALRECLECEFHVTDKLAIEKARRAIAKATS